jgi:hypothetical protein
VNTVPQASVHDKKKIISVNFAGLDRCCHSNLGPGYDVARPHKFIFCCDKIVCPLSNSVLFESEGGG